MIESFRNLSHSLGAKIFFGFLALCFIFLWGGNEAFRMIGIANDQTLATVGSHKIRITDFQKEFSRAIVQLQVRTGEQFDANMLKNEQFFQQILNNLIIRNIFDEQAQNLQIGVSSTNAAQTIKSLDIFHDQNKKFSHDRFMQIVNRLGFDSEQEYVNLLKSDLLKERFLKALNVKHDLPTNYFQKYIEWFNQIRTFECVVININQISLKSPVTEDELRSYYGEQRQSFIGHESRSFDVLEINHEAFANRDTVKAEEIAEIYEAEKDLKYKNIDQPKAYVQIKEVLKQEKINQRIDEIGKTIGNQYDAGKSLSQLREQPGITFHHYDDKVLVDPKANPFNAELTKVAFEQEENALSYLTPLKSVAKSVYVIVTKIKPAHILSFKEAYTQLKERVELEKKFKVAQEKAEAARIALTKGELIPLYAQKQNYKHNTFRLRRYETIGAPALPLVPGIVAHLFNVPQGQVTVIPTEDKENNSYLLIGKITEKQMGSYDKLSEEEKNDLSERFQGAGFNDLMTTYINTLHKNSKVEVNEKLLKKLLSPAKSDS